MNVTIRTQDEFQHAHVTVEIRRDGVREDERYTLVPADSERVEQLEAELRSTRGVVDIYRRDLFAAEGKRIELGNALDRAQEETASVRVARDGWHDQVTTLDLKVTELEGVIAAQARALRSADRQLGKIREVAERVYLASDTIKHRDAVMEIRRILTTSPQEETSQA